ncbi:MAG: hypothetical protein JEY97_06385 [Bacteroidales bacterium]|nr:hypothetical protein [Bacteroidales bacterium]
MAGSISLVLIIIQTISLIKYINKTNSNLASFLLRIQSKDTAVNYLDNHILKSFKGLNISFEQINKELQQLKIENEQKTHYLSTIVNHVKIGIIAFNNKGKIELFNPEAIKILKCENFHFMNILAEKFPAFHDIITNTANEKTLLVKLNLNNEILNLSIKKTLINIGLNTIHIISFQNIRRELDHNELESWQKLIMVLNHEIINSITPITSLSKTIRRYLHKEGAIKKVSALSDEIIKDIAVNTEIIEERGKGLIDFIEVYKEIAKHPKLNLSKFKVYQIIQRVQNFYQQKFNELHIRFESKGSSEIELNADEALIEQMLMNLTKNSMEAVFDKINPHIRMESYKSETGSIIIKIDDNGEGIPESEQDKIFIPFYTTKKNGSGIGLSLSKQIMDLHNGSISVSSHPDIKTSFILRF